MLARKPTRPRRWTCTHCKALVEAAKRKCHSCGIGRTTKRTSLRSRADTLWANWIKRKGMCQRCGLVGPVDAAHIIGRAQLSVRHDPWNGLALCRPCHRAFDSYKVDREELIIRLIGAEQYAALRLRSTRPWGKDYVLTISGLKELVP